MKRAKFAAAFLVAAAIALPSCEAAQPQDAADPSGAESVAAVEAPSDQAENDAETTEAAAPQESEAETTETQPAQPQEEPMLAITANGTTFLAAFEDNSSARALADRLQDGPLTLELHDYGDFEKVGPLGFDLPANDEQITTAPGDVILYQGNQITIYYDTNTWSFTRLAHIDGVSRDDLLDVFGGGDVTVELSLQ